MQIVIYCFLFTLQYQVKDTILRYKDTILKGKKK
jgi:hypothetical protein